MERIMFLIKNEMSNVCAKMFLSQSSSFNTMIPVTLETAAVYSSETSACIHDTKDVITHKNGICFMELLHRYSTYCF
jgi:hypothetical protein